MLVKEQAVYRFSVSCWKRLNTLVMCLHVMLLSYCSLCISLLALGSVFFVLVSITLSILFSL